MKIEKNHYICNEFNQLPLVKNRKKLKIHGSRRGKSETMDIFFVIMAYRIDGFKQIEAFYEWVFNNPDKARPTHVSLYLFLWNQGNRSKWVEWFKCPYDLAMQGACIGNNGTYYKCLDELKKFGLIDYRKGINNFKAPLINLKQLYDSEQLTEHVTVPQCEQQTVQQYAQQYVQQTEQQPVHIYNYITNNIKLITDNESVILKFFDSLKKQSKENNKIQFDVFWNLYNKKVGSKSKCEKKWNNLNLETQKKIIDTLPTFLKSITDKQYQPYAETYLNQERWNDEIQTKPEHAMNKLREFYKECEQPHERQRIHKIAMIFEQTKVLKYKPIDFTHDFMYEHLRSCMQHFTRWEGELENFILKNDNENKSIKQLFIEFRNKYRD